MITYKVTEYHGKPGASHIKNVERIQAKRPNQAFAIYKKKHPGAKPGTLTCSRPLTAAFKIRNLLH